LPLLQKGETTVESTWTSRKECYYMCVISVKACISHKVC